MSKLRYAKQVDPNQAEIVKALRKINGIKVQLDCDDILVGYKGRTYWYEIKESPTSKVKDSQYKLLQTWTGHYLFIFCVDDILEDIGIKQRTRERLVFTPIWHALIRDGQTPAKANKWASEGLKRCEKDNFESPHQIIVDTIKEGIGK